MSTAPPLDLIQKTLEAHPQIHDWTLEEVHQDSTQLYLISTEPEAARLVHTVLYTIEIFRDHAGGRGQASISLHPGDLDHLDARIEEAVYLAGMSSNPPFTLPRPAAAYPTVESWDAAIGTPPAAARVAAGLAEEVRAVLGQESQIRLSSMELFLDSATITLRTSTGVHAARQGTRAGCELVITSRNDAGEESEAQSLWERRRAADLDVAGRAHRQAQYARDSLLCRLPVSGECLVVIPAETMLPFFEAVTYRSAASIKYRQATPWEIGRPIVESRAPIGPGGPYDRLDIESDATLPYGLATRAFDEQGLPASRYALITDGVLQRYWASQRYADYLGIEVTGRVANIRLAPGPRPAAALHAPLAGVPQVEVVTFSWLHPDEITGDFTGEIRLGYQITPAGRVPIKGGAISGNVFTALTQAQFSQETAFLGNYQGPQVCRFHGLTVAG